MVFSWLFRGPLLSRKTVFGAFFFVAFSWLFRGPRFGQILRVLALEQSSEKGSCGETVVQKGVFGESVSSLLP